MEILKKLILILIIFIFLLGLGKCSENYNFSSEDSCEGLCIYNIKGNISLVREVQKEGEKIKERIGHILLEKDKNIEKINFELNKRIKNSQEILESVENSVQKLYSSSFTSQHSNECGSVPTDGCTITKDTVFRRGNYYLPNGIEIISDGITLDCNGSTLTGNFDSFGINIFNRTDITVKNCVITNFMIGISLVYSSENTIKENIINSNYYAGILMYSGSDFNTIESNTLNSDYLGIYGELSSNNKIRNNTLKNNEYGMWIYSNFNDLIEGNRGEFNSVGIYLNKSSNVLISSNKIANSKFCGFYLFSNSNNNIRNNMVNNSLAGFYLDSSSKNNLKNNTAFSNKWGIFLFSSFSNELKFNTLDLNEDGIVLDSSNNNFLDKNFLGLNTKSGIYLSYSDDNTIKHNTAESDAIGIYFFNSHDNIIKENIVKNSSEIGLGFSFSNGNLLSDNDVTKNFEEGILLAHSRKNILLNNKILDNGGVGIFLLNSSENTINNSNIKHNEKGIHFFESDDNNLYMNRLCYNTQDFSFSRPSTNYGDDNICDSPGTWILWKDKDTVGCSYSCSKERCDKFELGSAKGFSLLNFENNDCVVDLIDWFKDSKHSSYEDFLNLSCDSVIEFELDVPKEAKMLRIAYNFFLFNSENKENSQNLLQEIYIYNFDENVWENVYFEESIPSDFEESIINIPITEERRYNNKIKLKARLNNLDNNPDFSYACQIYEDSVDCRQFSLDRFVYQFCQNPFSLFISPSVSYDIESSRLNIQVYAYDIENGEEVKSGHSSYRIIKSNRTITGGKLEYDGLWKTTKTINLSSGEYLIELNINGFVESTNFYTGKKESKIYGSVKDSSGLVEATINLYKALEYPNRVLYSIVNDSYSFIVEPGSYVVEAAKDGEIFTTLAFSIDGGEEIKRDLFLGEKKGSLKWFLYELKKELENKLSEETTKISDLTEMVSNDLSSDDAMALANAISDGVTDNNIPTISFIAAILEKTVPTFTSRIAYGRTINYLINNTRELIISYRNGDGGIEVFSWLMDSEGGFKKRTVQEIKDKEIYKKSLQLINQSYNDLSFHVNDNFDFLKAKKIIGDQLTQLKGISAHEELLLLPDPSTEPIVWNFENYYNSYLENHRTMKYAKLGKKIALSLQAVIGIVVSIIASPVAGLTTFVTLNKISTPFYIALNLAQFSTQILAVQNYAFTSAEWIIDTAKIPFIYNKTIVFIQRETEEPYYLNKNKFFDSELEINLNPDKVINGKNFVFPSSSLGLTVRNVTVRVKNLLDPSLTRVLAGSVSEIEKNKEKTTSLLGYDYLSVNLSSNQEIEKNLSYFGLDQSQTGSIFDPHILVVQIFSGPFQTTIDTVHYFVLSLLKINQITYQSSYKTENFRLRNVDREILNWEKIKEAELPMRSIEKQFTVEDFVRFTPLVYSINAENSNNLEKTYSTNFNGKGDNKINLNSNRPEFSFNYTVGNSYGVEFQLFHPLGADVDLDVYYGGHHVGFNPFSGKDEIGFPGTYSGKYKNPEIIYIPNAANKTYEVRARLIKENTNLSVPIKLNILEIPFRPAVLMVFPDELNQEILLGENFSLYFTIGEVGKQKPIHNVTVNIDLGLANLSKKDYHFSKIDASSLKEINFSFQATETGNFSGKLKVNSSIGEIIANIEIFVSQVQEKLPGDVNGDCKVNIFDLAAIGLAYGSERGESHWNENADLNNDGKINIFDLAIVGLNYGKVC